MAPWNHRGHPPLRSFRAPPPSVTASAPWLGRRCDGGTLERIMPYIRWHLRGCPERDTNTVPPLGGTVCVSLSPLRWAGLQTTFLSRSYLRVHLAHNPAGQGKTWFRDEIATNTGSDPHSSHTLTPPLPASLSAPSGGGCRFSFPTVKILRRLLTVGILKYFRQSAARAESSPPVGN